MLTGSSSEFSGEYRAWLLGGCQGWLLNRFGDITGQILSSPQIAAEEANIAIHGAVHNDFTVPCEELTPHC